MALGIIAIISYWWFFISTNVNPNLGNVYTNLTLGAAIFIIGDYIAGRRDIKIVNKNVSWGMVIAITVVSYIVLLLSSKLAMSLSTIIPLSAILGLLATSAPVFSKSPLINFITFGDVVAYIETFALFIAGYDLLASMFNIEIKKENLKRVKLWVIIFGLSLLFLMFHVTAKGIENNQALLLVFFMAVISMVIATIYQDARPVVGLHILANSIAAFPMLFQPEMINTILTLIPKEINILLSLLL